MTRLLGALAILVFVLRPSPASAQPPDLTTLQMEDLMKIEIAPVFGASRRLQPVTEAPSSVTIVTAEDIVKFGYRSLEDILRAARGFYVSTDRNYSYAGARGFSQPGDYNTRVLVLVDGHRINDAIYDQAPVGHELGLDPTTFERVEIIRGPSSALYGTSAFFAVVNIVTKTAEASTATVRVTGGQLGTWATRAQAGGTTAGGLRGFVAASIYDSQGERRIRFPEFSDVNDGIAEDLDGERSMSAFAKLAFKSLSMTAAVTTRSKSVPTGAYGTTFNDPSFETTDGRAYVDLQSSHTIGKARLNLQGFVDRYYYNGTYPYGFEDDSSSRLLDEATAVWWGLSARSTTPIGARHVLTAGTELRHAVRQDQSSRSVPPDPDADFAIEQSSIFWAAFVDDEIRLHSKVLLNAGVRYDAYDGFNRLTPRAAVIVNRTPNEAIKYLFGTAFRAPNAYELDYYTGGTRAEGLEPESIVTHEVVWERYVGDWLRASASAYWNDVTDLIRLVSDDDGDLFFRNIGRVRAQGIEFEGEVRSANGLRAVGSYGLQRAEDRDSGLTLTNSPRHLWQARGWAPLWRPGSALSVELRHQSDRETLRRQVAHAATAVNVGVIIPLSGGLQVEGFVRNLFNAASSDPGSEEHLQDVIPQYGRVARIGLAWRWAKQ